MDSSLEFASLDKDCPPQQRLKVSVQEHPDTVLRALGIFRQKGRCRRQNVEFDSTQQCWINSATGKTLDITPDQVTDKVDETPASLIRVLGDFDIKNFVTDTDGELKQQDAALEELDDFLNVRKMLDTSKGDGMTKVKSFNLGAEKRKRAQMVQAQIEPSSHVMAAHTSDHFFTNEKDVLVTMREEDEAYKELLLEEVQKPDGLELIHQLNIDFDYLNPTECGRLVAQYLARSVIGAAENRKSLILCSAGDSICRMLAMGVEAKQTSSTLPFSVLGLFSDGSAEENGKIQEGLTHRLLLREKDGHPCDAAGLEHYATLMQDWLASGYTANDRNQDSTKMMEGRAIADPPSRSAIPVCTILMGGKPSIHKLYLRQSIEERWPVIVIDGSGGYADMIASLKSRLRQFKYQDKDWCNLVGQLDPITAEFMAHGKAIIVPQGKSPDELERVIVEALKIDGTLELAWRQWYAWMQVARDQYTLWTYMQRTIQFLQVSVTTVAIVTTFLRVKGVDLESSLNLGEMIIILFPILVTLLGALESKLSPGNKWLVFSVASAELQKEIFGYRTYTGQYGGAKQAVRGKSGSAITSPAQKLQAAMKEIGERLMIIDEVSAHTVEPYTGPVPPPEIVANGDDGFSTLLPERYLEVRVVPAMNAYYKEAVAAGRRHKFALYIGFVMAASGTAFAAIGTYFDGAFTVFVALTTCLMSAAAKYDNYTRAAWLQEKYNESKTALNNIHSLWTGKTSLFTKPGAVNDLVEAVEGIMVGEAKSKAEQMGQVLQDAKNDLEDTIAAAEVQAKNAQEETQRKALQLNLVQQGLETLNPESLKTALLDPKSLEGRKVSDVLVSLNRQLGDFAKPVKDAAAKIIGKDEVKQLESMANSTVSTAKKVHGTALDLHKEAKQVAKAVNSLSKLFSDDLPRAVQTFVDDLEERDKILAGFKSTELLTGVNPLAILKVARDVKSRLYQEMKFLSGRDIMNASKALVSRGLVDEFFKGFRTMTPGMKELSNKIVESNKFEDFICQMMIFSSSAVRDLSFQGFFNLIKDPVLKAAFMKLGKSGKDIIIQRAEDFFDLDRENHMLGLLNRLSSTLACRDIQELVSTEELGGFSLCETYYKVRAIGLETALKAFRQDMVAMFPPAMQSLLQGKSNLQIQWYLQTVASGTPAVRIWNKAHTRLLEYGDFNKALANEPVLSERLVLASQVLLQEHIDKCSKGAIIRRLRGSPHFCGKLEEILQKMEYDDMNRMLSVIQATMSGTWGGRLSMMISDAIKSFHTMEILKVESRDAILSDSEFFDGTKDINNMKKSEILANFKHSPAYGALADLNVNQLRELGILVAYMPSVLIQIHSRIFMMEKIRPLLRRYSHLVTEWDGQMMGKLIGLAGENQILEFDKFFKTKSDIEIFCSDAVLNRGFLGLDFASIRELLITIRYPMGALILERIFNAALWDISNSKLRKAYVSCFADPKAQEQLCILVGQVLEDIQYKTEHFPYLGLREYLKNYDLLWQGLGDLSDEDVSTMVFLWWSEFLTSVRLGIYYDACRAIWWFDFSDCGLTQDVKCEIVEWHVALIELLEHSDEYDGFKIQEKETGEVELLIDEVRAEKQKLAIGERLREMDVAKESAYARLTTLKLDQFVSLMKIMFHMLRNTEAGKLLLQLERNRCDHPPFGCDLECTQRKALERDYELEIGDLKRESRIYPEHVREHFEGLEAERFLNIIGDKERLLVEVRIDSEPILNMILQFDEVQLKGLFRHLQASCGAGCLSITQRIQIYQTELKVCLNDFFSSLSNQAQTSAQAIGIGLDSDPEYSDVEENDDDPLYSDGED